MSFVSLPGKMGNPLAAQRFDMTAIMAARATSITWACTRTTATIRCRRLPADDGDGYPNLLMPGGFYNNQVHTKKVDPILQDNLSWQLKNHFLQFGVYWETGHIQRHCRFRRLPAGRVHIQSGQRLLRVRHAAVQLQRSCELRRTQAPRARCGNSGANYLGSCFNPYGHDVRGLCRFL